MTALLTKSHFDEHLHGTFILEHPAAQVVLELVSVVGGPASVQGGEQFSLLFRAPGMEYCPQATYRLRHDVLGEMDTFLVPVQRDAQGLYYEAVYNRMRIDPPE